MKNYSLNYEESKQFIRKYTIKNGQIIAALANGEKYIIPYTEENERNILERMEEQVEDAYIKNLDRSTKVFAVTQPLLLPIAIINMVFHGGIFFAILLAIIALGAISYPLQVLSHYIKKSDLKKSKFFLQNKQKLNDNTKINVNVLSGVSKKTIKQIEQTPVDKPVFDINVIDNISLSDLKTLKDNIERDQAFGFQQEQPTTEKVKKLNK